MNNSIGLILLGVSGSGKTTIGKLLSKKINIQFIDADDYHSKKNIQLMSKGKPLDDKLREPWLYKINKAFKKKLKTSNCVLACSLLKKKYRKTIKKNISNQLHFIYLKGSEKLIQERIKKRKNHFMNNSLLKSQFNSLEEPSNSLTIDVNKNPKEIISIITENVFY